MTSKPKAVTAKPKPEVRKQEQKEPTEEEKEKKKKDKKKHKREKQKERKRLETNPKLSTGTRDGNEDEVEGDENEDEAEEDENEEVWDEDDKEMVQKLRSLDLKDREISPRRSTRTRTKYERIPTIATIPVGKFANSASEFGEYEEGQLNITNVYDNSAQTLFPEFNYGQDFSNMTGFADALLPAYNTYEDLLNTSKCQTDNQRTLIIKLQEVFANNYVLGTSRRDEGAVDDFVHYLLSMLEFDKYPIQVRTRPLLDLEIGQWLFATISDFGIRSHESVYLSVMEDKHKKSKTYKKGRLQLACGMVAGAQLRCRINEPQPYHMFGVLVVADQFAFAQATITKAYLDSLDNKTAPPRLEVHWWPSERNSRYPNFPNPQTMFGVPYGEKEHRETIVKTLCLLRQKFVTDINK